MISTIISSIVLLGCSLSLLIFSKCKKLQITLMVISLIWSMIFGFFAYNYFIINKTAFTLSILSFDYLLYGAIAILSIITYPIIATSTTKKPTKTLIIISLPIVLIIIINILWNIVMGIDINHKFMTFDELWSDGYTTTSSLRLLLLLTMSTYTVFIINYVYKLIPIYNKHITDNYTDTSDNLKWIYYYVIFLLEISIIYAISCFYKHELMAITFNIITISSFVVMTIKSIQGKIFTIGNNLEIQYNLLEGWNLTELIPLPDNHTDYNKIFSDFEEWITSSEPYRNNNFTINEIYDKYPKLAYPVLTRLLARKGYTFQSYIRKLRIELACRLMEENTQMKIKEIAYHVGFSSADSFSRSFCKETSISPKEFRKNILQTNN